MLWDIKGSMADFGSRIGLIARSSPIAPIARPLAAMGGVSAAALATIMLFSTSTAVESALASAMADPAAILAARSPGARAPGALTQTKLAYAKPPVERALGQERTRPTAAVPGAPVAALPAALPTTQQTFGAPVADAADPVVASPGLVSTAGVPVSGLTAVGGGGGGGGTGGGTGGGGTTPVDPPVSAVPEPSTWMMTILGFFAAGLGLRRRRAVPTGAVRAL